MNAFDSNDFPKSSLGFVCFALTAIFMFLITSEMNGQSQFYHQPSIQDLSFTPQPQIKLSPFKQHIRIMPFNGTAEFDEFHHSELLNEVQVYPNPTAEYVNILIEEDSEISIYNMQGSLIKVKAYEAGSYSLDVTELTDGSYILMVNSEYGTKSAKLLIEK